MDQKDIVSALIDVYFDKYEEVSDVSFKSICIISERQCNLVLECCLIKFKDKKFNKIQINHLLKCLKLLQKITRDINEELDNLVKDDLINFLISIIKKLNDMSILKDNDLQKEFENLVSSTLTGIGKKYCHDVTNELLNQFNLNENLNLNSENFFIVRTIGDLCIANPMQIFKFVKIFLDEFLPVILITKLDNQKYVLAYTISCIATSIQENLANEEANKPFKSENLNIQNFENNFDSIFDVFYTWINLKESSTKEQVIKAIGSIAPLISKKKFEETNLKIIEFLLSTYKKQNISLPLINTVLNIFYVSQCLNQVLNVALDNNCGLMSDDLCVKSNLQLDNLCSVLFYQLTLLTNSRYPNSINNYNEILRIFSSLCIKNSEKIVTFILQKFETTNISIKVTGLTVLKHLIDTRINEINKKFSLIFYVLHTMVEENNNRLKKILIQVIVSIAYKGYLNMDGGKSLIQFIIKQCSISQNDSEIELKKLIDSNSVNSISSDNNVSNYTLKKMAENVLPLFVITIEDIEKILWPQLFEYLVLPEYNNAVGTLCKALYVMGKKMIENKDDQFNVDFDKNVFLPKKEHLMARLTILIADDPYKNLENIKNFLNLMSIIHKLINPKLEILWVTVCKQYLEILINDEQLDKEDWQHKCLALINQSLIEIFDEEFLLKFGKCLLLNFHFYNDNLDLKFFTLQVLANVARRLNQKIHSEFIMDQVMSKVDLNNEIEHTGCAILFGQCAANHLDLVLVKLEQYLDYRKNFGFISSILLTLRSSNQNDLDKIKCAIILGYGYVTKYAPSSLLITRIETPILTSINSLYQSSKNNVHVRNAFVNSIKIIATSMTPENLNMIYLLKGRTQLIYEMINIAKLSENSISIIVNSIETLSLLVMLDPPLTLTEKSTLIEVILKTIYSWEETELLNAFKLLLKNILRKDAKNIDNLNIIMEILVPHMLILKNDNSKVSLIKIIKFVLDEFELNLKPGDFLKLNNFCCLYTYIFPYCFDELYQIRLISLDCLVNLVSISIKAQSKDVLNDELFVLFNESIEKCKLEDSEVEVVADELSKFLVKKLRTENNQSQAILLIVKLISSINDFPIIKKSCGLALIAYELTKSFISNFHDEVLHLIDIVYLVRLDYIKTNSILVKLLFELASNHLDMFCNHLLIYQLSFDDSIVKFWNLLSGLKEFSELLIVWFMDNLNEENLIIYDRKIIQMAIAKPEQLAMVCALGELFKQNQNYEIACKYSEKLFPCLLLVLANYVRAEYVEYDSLHSTTRNSTTKSNFTNITESTISNISVKGNSLSNNEIKKLKPITCAIFTMKQYLNLLKHDKMLLSLESQGCWKLIEENNQFHVSISLISKSICLYFPSIIPFLVQPLLKSLKNNLIETKIVSLVFFSNLLSIKYYPDKELLNEIFLNTIMNMVNDNSFLIRLLAIKSLSSIEGLEKENQKYILPIVSALLNALDDANDKNDRIKFESLNNLCIVIYKIDLILIKDLVINLIIRLKSLFNNEKFYIRQKSTEAIGWLMKNEDLKSFLKEESFNLIIPLLINLNDTVSDVIKTTKFTMKKLVTFLNVESIETLVLKNLSEETNLHYIEFISAITKLMVVDLKCHVNNFISMLLIYMKSDSIRTQCNSMQILGYLINNDPNKEIVDNELKKKAILLIVHYLKDSNNLEARMKAAETLTSF